LSISAVQKQVRIDLYNEPDSRDSQLEKLLIPGYKDIDLKLAAHAR
jgi:hypothetical protein